MMIPVDGPCPLRVARVLRGLSQHDLAERAHVARETVSRVERGMSPQLRTARALSGALGVPIPELFPMNDERPAGTPGVVTTAPKDGGRRGEP